VPSTPTTSNPTIPYDYVLAVDPGVATGWADCRVSDLVINSGAENDQLNFCMRADTWMQWRRGDGSRTVVVCERFLITERTAKLSQQPASLEIIGCVRYLAWKYAVTFAPLQAPGDAKKFITNDRLRQAGLYSTNDHARDALRHLLLFLVNQGDKRVLEMIK
jgi:hypothetical protein